MGNNYSIEINHLIVLCHIIDKLEIDEFENFEKKLKVIISTNNNRNFMRNLREISKGKFKLGAIKERRFYKENKSIIDTISKYSNVSKFIHLNYAYLGNPSHNLQFFYQYLIEHKNELDKVLTLLAKLKELGFTSIEFKENLDLTSKQYYINSNHVSDFPIAYVDNIETIPSYGNNIKYKTQHSNYIMYLRINFNEIYLSNDTIELNSLLFDPNRLPKRIDKETIFDPILKLKEEQQEKSAPIRNSVDLSISILDLETQLGNTAYTINKLEGVKNKKELIEALFNIKQDVEKLRTLSQQYDRSISEKEPTLTHEILDKEKKLYLKRRREWESMHSDCQEII